MSESYKEAIMCLRKRYDRPRLVQEEHIRSIMDAVPVKNGSDKELRCLYDAATQHYRALKAAKAESFKLLLTVQKLDEKTQLKLAEFNSDSKNVRLCTKFLKFLDLHVRLLKCVFHTRHKQASGFDCQLHACQAIFRIIHR